ncbi:MAG: hypothetical protein AB7Q42_24025 [Acidimicrobiia bacterium]
MKRRSFLASALLASALLALATGALTALTLLAPPAEPAAAQDVPGLALHLVSQPMTVAPNGDLVVVLGVDGELPVDAELVVTTYQLAASRDAVRAAVEQNGGIANDLLRFPVSAIPRDDDGNLVVTIGTETDPGDASRIRLRNPGLYPLSLDIRLADDDPLASLVTFVERTGDDAITETIGATAVLTFDAAPSLQATGLLQIPPEVRPRLDALISLLEQSPVPLSVSVRPEVLDSLSQSGDPADAERLARLDEAVGTRHELLVAPYISMNPGTAVAAGLQETFTEQLRLGEDELSEALPSAELERSTWVVTSGIDLGGVSFLRDLGVRRLVVDDKAMGSTVERPGELAGVRSSTNEVIPALVADATFEAALTSGGGPDPVLTAHHLVAELIALGIEQEQVTLFDPTFPARGVALTVGAFDDIDPTLFLLVAELIDDTARVEPETASSVLRTLERSTDDDQIAVVRTTTIDPEPTITLADLIARVTAGVETTVPMLPENDPRPTRWRSLLRMMPADNLSERQQRSYVLQLDGEVGDVRSSVTVQPQSGIVNLGGRRSKIPLTLVNTSDIPLTVVVRLSSPGPKITFPDGDQTVEVTGRMRIEIPVESRTNGRSPVTVQLFTPLGGSVLTGPEQFTVQATALTGLGQVVTAAFVLILISWWIQHARAARRAQRNGEATGSQSRHPTGHADPSGPVAVPPAALDDR